MNIPQNRERIFIIAFEPTKVKNYKKFAFPPEVELTTTIHDILEKDRQEDKYYYKKTILITQNLKSVTNKTLFINGEECMYVKTKTMFAPH